MSWDGWCLALCSHQVSVCLKSLLVLGRPWELGAGHFLWAVHGWGQLGTLSKLGPQLGVYSSWGTFLFLRPLRGQKGWNKCVRVWGAILPTSGWHSG